MPVIGLILMGISALLTATMTSDDINNRIGPTGNGIGQPSSLAGVSNGETVTRVASGNRSWTQTGQPCNDSDGLSATSGDELECTATNQIGVGNQTSDRTTAVANEGISS